MLAEVPFATADEVNLAVSAAENAFKTWSEVATPERARLFLNTKNYLKNTTTNLPKF